MGKYQFCLIIVLLILLVGCRSEKAGRSTPEPEEYLTALEAYERIRPAMLAWHEDAVVSYISSSLSEQVAERVRADGKSARWSFTIYSPSAQKETRILWTKGEIRVGMPDIQGGEISVPGGKKGLPINDMIDTDEAVRIALQNGANGTLYYIEIDHYDSKTDRYIPTSWGLTYGHLYDWSQQQLVIINAATGEVLRNDFAEQ